SRSNDYRSELGGGRGAEQGHVESGGLGQLIEWALHQRVGHDTHDGAPRLFFAGIENAHLVAKRTFVAPMFPGKARVHDRHRLFRVTVVDREIAPLTNL